jgi:hypothetical protein
LSGRSFDRAPLWWFDPDCRGRLTAVNARPADAGGRHQGGRRRPHRRVGRAGRYRHPLRRGRRRVSRRRPRGRRKGGSGRHVPFPSPGPRRRVGRPRHRRGVRRRLADADGRAVRREERRVERVRLRDCDSGAGFALIGGRGVIAEYSRTSTLRFEAASDPSGAPGDPRHGCSVNLVIKTAWFSCRLAGIDP